MNLFNAINHILHKKLKIIFIQKNNFYNLYNNKNLIIVY